MSSKNSSDSSTASEKIVSSGDGGASKLGVAHALDLVRRLGETVAEAAAREEEIENDNKSNTYATRRRYERAIEAAEKELAAETGAATIALDSGTAHSKDRRDSRESATNRAYRTSRPFQKKAAQDEKENRLGSIQFRKRQAENDRAQALEEAAVAYNALEAELKEKQADLKALRKQAVARFRGYWGYLKKLKRKPADTSGAAATEGGPAAQDLVSTLGKQLEDSRHARDRFGAHLLPKVFQFLPLQVVVIPLALAAYLIADSQGGAPDVYWRWGGLAAAIVAVLFVLQRLGKKASATDAAELAGALNRAADTADLAAATNLAEYEATAARVEAGFAKEIARLDEHWNEVQELAPELQRSGVDKVEQQVVRLRERNEADYARRIAGLEAAHDAAVAEAQAVERAAKAEAETNYASETAEVDAKYEKALARLESEFKERASALYRDLELLRADTDRRFPAWSDTFMDSWKPEREFSHAARFGDLQVEVSALAGRLPENERLALPGPAALSVPLSLAIPTGGSILIETKEAGRQRALETLDNLVLRLLATTPPGRVTFTIFDPVGLGESFAGLMNLADHEESLISRRIWTQSGQLEQRLADINEHIEKVIQMYLRNEYESITQFNQQAGNIAEKYHFLVIADFPANVSDVAAKRLQSIATSGARCGVYTLMHWDHRRELPGEFVPEELRANSICIRADKGGTFVLDGAPENGASLALESPPQAEAALEFINKVGLASKDSNRVEVPFDHIAPPPDAYWQDDTTEELTIPIGRTGATKLQLMAIGKGTRQHALLAGKTGSGKSTLLHVLITNLALSCSPEQVEFYLVDFKKGVEFKCYAEHRLPHAKVIAIESDREFALSVLQRIDDELKRRGDLFRKAGVQDLAGYKKTSGAEAMPRSLLIIDEFQEYFVEDDRVAQTASVLLDRIVRQGRAFGIHVLLGSQTLGGAYTLARTTLGQMVIRIALQCNEADAYLIMDDNNPAPRLLSRPGEGIYNDASGSVEGNSPFQVVWLPDDVRDGYLEKISGLAGRSGKRYPAPVVFEGNAPADVRENAPLADLLGAAPPARNPLAARAFLGAPNSIKGPTEAAFERQGGNHLLIVGQRDESALAILGVGILSLAAQFPQGGARFVVFDGSAPGSPEREFLERVAAAARQDVSIAKPGDLASIMDELASDLKDRGTEEAGGDAPSIFLVINGIQKFKKLRQEDEFAFSMGDDPDAGGDPAGQFVEIITDGSTHGIHIIAVADSYNNVNRFLSRKALTEFEMRVVFQMSANDSASLVDSPKASDLGLHRALFYNEHEGYLETFRPYALPDESWVDGTARSG
ncbi:FtsK/SpoIIIE domain-containing protein [soil metagenome]